MCKQQDRKQIFWTAERFQKHTLCSNLKKKQPIKLGEKSEPWCHRVLHWMYIHFVWQLRFYMDRNKQNTIFRVMESKEIYTFCTIGIYPAVD